MTEKDLINYWQKTAADALKTAEGLFKLKRYHHCLFFCHLALEKLIKGLVFKKKKRHAPPIHNLKKLIIKHARVSLSPKQVKDFEEISSWNIRARYDNIKQEFYKKSTKQFTTVWFKKVKEYYKWLKNQY